MDIAIIVLNYNDYETTEKLINNVKDFDVIDKVIVVDNNSSDNSLEVLSKYQNDKIDVIKTDKNKGYGGGNNYGIKYAIKQYQPKYIVIANPDVILEEDTFIQMKKFYDENTEKVGIVSCHAINTSESKSHTAWKLPRFSDCILENLILIKSIFFPNVDNYSEDYFEGAISKVDVVLGAFFMIASEAMQDVEFFDEDTFLYGEENILAYKLKQKGYSNYLLNDYTYIHNHSVSISKNIKSIGKKFDMGYDSKCVYLDKYLNVGKIKKIINKITYEIGKATYLVARKIVNK